jgi:hypothetical protein
LDWIIIILSSSCTGDFAPLSSAEIFAGFAYIPLSIILKLFDALLLVWDRLSTSIFLRSVFGATIYLPFQTSPFCYRHWKHIS